MAAAVGGLLPDLDHPKSALGRRLRLISLPLSAVVGHRGITHSLLAVSALLGLLIYATSAPFLGRWDGLISPLIIGYLSHILGDSMTPSGVPLLWPHKRRFSFNLFKTWSWQETAFVGLLTFAMLIFGGVAVTVWEDFLARLPLGALRQRIWIEH